MNINEALLAFAAEFVGAHKTGRNPHFKSDHFTLDDVINATTQVLQKHGLYVTHRTILTESGSAMATSVIHAESGTEITSKIPLPQLSDPQKVGSAITYYKRYNLCALLNIAEADDDGNAAAVPEPPPTPMLATDAQRLLLGDFIAVGAVNEQQQEWLKRLW
jgi:hypothetical protein